MYLKLRVLVLVLAMLGERGKVVFLFSLSSGKLPIRKGSRHIILKLWLTLGPLFNSCPY